MPWWKSNAQYRLKYLGISRAASLENVCVCRRHAPKAGAAAVNLHPRLVGGRIIEGASEDNCQRRQHIGFGDDTRSAIRAKPSAHLLSRVAGIIVGLQFAFCRLTDADG
jgi:hypothetical protein